MIKVAVGLLALTAISVGAESLQEAFRDASIDGYIRGTYHLNDTKSDSRYHNDAIGGKLHLESSPLGGVSLGVGFYTSNSISSSDNRSIVPLRGESDKSYSILGEAYIKGEFGNTMVKIGRQEIETPFAQIDDIGIVPNTFEAFWIENRDIADTTIMLAQIQKMAGVDAEVVDRFTHINGDKNMQTIGIDYKGIKNLTLSSWYYNLEDGEIDKIAYIEADYENSFDRFGYGVGLQYAKESYDIGESADVVGATISGTIKKSGLTLSSSYTESRGNSAYSGFGGGPFFSNSEYLIIDNAGEDAKATKYAIEWDGAVAGAEGLNMSLGEVTLEDKVGAEATELDFILGYEIDKNLEMHLIYSDIDGNSVAEEEMKHLRAFVNYNF